MIPLYLCWIDFTFSNAATVSHPAIRESELSTNRTARTKKAPSLLTKILLSSTILNQRWRGPAHSYFTSSMMMRMDRFSSSYSLSYLKYYPQKIKYTLKLIQSGIYLEAHSKRIQWKTMYPNQQVMLVPLLRNWNWLSIFQVNKIDKNR